MDSVFLWILKAMFRPTIVILDRVLQNVAISSMRSFFALTRNGVHQ